MMAASKTRLREYTEGGRSVFAAQITSVADVPPSLLVNNPGAKTIRFMKPTGPSQAHMTAAWVAEHNPQVGDYFVVEDDDSGRTTCRKLAAAVFERRYKERR